MKITHRYSGATLWESPCSNLCNADLCNADLRNADLRGADLRDAYLGGAYLRDANLGEILDDVPLVENIDAAILIAVEQSQKLGKTGLDMSKWHTCESTHCRAGWAITLAGEQGRKLEDQYGPAVAGSLIYLRAGAERIPNWYASNDRALADMRERAGVSV